MYVITFRWCVIVVIVIILIVHRIVIVDSTPVNCFTAGTAAVHNVSGIDLSKVIILSFSKWG